MSTTVTLVQGDNLGPDVVAALVALIRKAGAEITFETVEGTPGVVTPELLAAIRRNGVALMGHHWGRRDSGEVPPVVQLRRELGIYANLRPIVTRYGFDAVYQGVDFWVVRETTEDIYAHLEHESLPGVFESIKVTTRAACERIARYAFEFARTRGRKKVTTVHKSNIMKLSDGLFLRTCQEVATEYPEILHDEVIVDALCMKLVLDPTQFDVLVAGNLFGDIVGDLGAGLVGGASNTPSINVGEGVGLFTLGQPLSSDAAEADPLPLLLTSLYMLEHLGQDEARQRLGDAAEAAVRAGIRTVSLGGDASLAEYIEAVSARL